MSQLEETWSRCSVVLDSQNKTVTMSHKDHGEYDVNHMLMFGQDLSAALEFHSPNIAWWASMVQEEKSRLNRFEEGPYVQIMAHFRYYAKLALKGMGDKETLESVKDCVVLLFSRNRQKLSDTMMKAAWYGHLTSAYGTASAVKKYLDSLNDEEKVKAQDEFHENAYFWENAHGVTYDDVLDLHSEIQKNVEVLSKVLGIFEQRGILLSSVAADKRAETKGMSVSTINKVVEEAIAKEFALRNA